jgi:Flp pilus assembly protein TadG
MKTTAKEKTTRYSQAGQTMVEFMLVIVVVFIVFISMVQMILLMHAYNTLADAAKEGVRFAIVHGTGFGSGCSGPGSVKLTPSVSCGDLNTNCASNCDSVVNAVTHFAAVSFQNVSSSNVTVSYDPASANTNNTNFGAACSQPGCAVRVTVNYTYTPLFGLGWPNFTLNAAADGIVAN